jgi:hypothetical protein
MCPSASSRTRCGHFGFLLFNIYEPMQEFKRGGRPVLRRTNPVFINARLVDTRGIA